MAKSSKESAGLLMYRVRIGQPVEVLLGHPGGPFWAKKDDGAWTIPKGEVAPGEGLLDTAKREVLEETGFMPDGPFVELGTVTQKSGKVVHAWAVAHDGDTRNFRSNMIEIDWPPRSGRGLMIPELDRAEYFTLDEAQAKLNPAQTAFLDRLAAILATRR